MVGQSAEPPTVVSPVPPDTSRRSYLYHPYITKTRHDTSPVMADPHDLDETSQVGLDNHTRDPEIIDRPDEGAEVRR